MSNCRKYNADDGTKAETVTEQRKMLEDAISSKKALHALEAMVKAQGGDSDYILYP